MKYRAIIFDLFGTLIDNFSRREYEAVFGEMAEILSVPPQEFLHAWAESFEQRVTGVYQTTSDAIMTLSRKLNPGITDAQIKQAARIRLDYIKRSIIPRDGATEVLGQLRAEGYRTGLISDCTCEVTNVWESTTLAPLFDVTVFSCVARIRKPDPRIYRIATDELSVEPQKCLYIGDGSSHELTGAAQVGMHPVLIRVPDESADTHLLEREENWNGPVIASLREVLRLLKQ